MDVLGDVLLGIRLFASRIGITDFGVPWNFEMAGDDPSIAAGMVVLDGPAWLETDTLPLTELFPGDSVLMLRGVRNRSMSSPDAPPSPFEEFLDHYNIGPMKLAHNVPPPFVRWREGDVRTKILCFSLVAQDIKSSSLLSNLDSTIVVRGKEGRPIVGLSGAIDFLAYDDRFNPGYAATASKFVELIFMSIIRDHILSDSAIGASWMRGLRDPKIGRAIACIHGRPGAVWTVDRLAAEAGMGRSTFARRFVELLGEPPADYLAQHRMQLACALLCVEKQPVAKVAESLGYRTERGFRHAFRARFGMSPSRYARSISGRK